MDHCDISSQSLEEKTPSATRLHDDGIERIVDVTTGEEHHPDHSIVGFEKRKLEKSFNTK